VIDIRFVCFLLVAIVFALSANAHGFPPESYAQFPQEVVPAVQALDSYFENVRDLTVRYKAVRTRYNEEGKPISFINDWTAELVYLNTGERQYVAEEHSFTSSRDGQHERHHYREFFGERPAEYHYKTDVLYLHGLFLRPAFFLPSIGWGWMVGQSGDGSLRIEVTPFSSRARTGLEEQRIDAEMTEVPGRTRLVRYVQPNANVKQMIENLLDTETPFVIGHVLKGYKRGANGDVGQTWALVEHFAKPGLFDGFAFPATATARTYTWLGSSSAYLFEETKCTVQSAKFNQGIGLEAVTPSVGPKTCVWDGVTNTWTSPQSPTPTPVPASRSGKRRLGR